MKLKTLLSTMESVPYMILGKSGYMLEEDYVRSDGYYETNFGEYKVIKIKTYSGCEQLFITIKDY